MMYLHHIVYAAGVFREYPGARRLLSIAVRYHRLGVPILAFAVFAHHLGFPSMWDATLVQSLLVFTLLLNIAYALFVSTVPALLRPTEGCLTGKIAADLAFATSYVYFEWSLLGPQTSTLAILFLIPLLLAGFYFRIGRLLLFYSLVAVLFLVVPPVLMGRWPSVPSELVIGLVILASSVVLHITGAYTEQHINAVAEMRGIVLRELVMYSTGVVSQAGLSKRLLGELLDNYEADYVCLAQLKPGSSAVSIVGTVGLASSDFTRLPRPPIKLAVHRSLELGTSFVGSVHWGSSLGRPVDPVKGSYFLCVNIPRIDEHSPRMALEIGRSGDIPFAEYEKNILKNAFDNFPHFERWRDEAHVMRFVRDLAGSRIGSMAEAEIMQRFLDLLSLVTPVQYCSYWKLDEGGQRLLPRVYLGFDDDFMGEIVSLGPDSLTYGILIEGKRQELIYDIWQEERLVHLDRIRKHYGQRLKCLLIVPLIVGESRLGALHFWSEGEKDLDRLSNIMSLAAPQLSSLVLASRTANPLVRHAMQDYADYLESNRLIKLNEQFGVLLSHAAQPDPVVTQNVQMTIRNTFDLYNISDQTDEIRFLDCISPGYMLSGYDIEKGTREYFVLNAEVDGKSVEDILFGDKSYDLHLVDEVNPNAKIEIKGKKTKRFTFTIKCNKALVGHDTVRTPRISLGPVFKVKWDNGIRCECFHYSHLEGGREARDSNSWFYAYKKRAAVLPFQGISINWVVDTPLSSHNHD